MSLIQIRHVLIHLLHGLFNGQLLPLSTREGQGLPSMPSAPSPRVLHKKTKEQTQRVQVRQLLCDGHVAMGGRVAKHLRQAAATMCLQARDDHPEP